MIAPPRIRRVADWPRRLEDFEARMTAARFEWGRRDCALMAADWVLEMTGIDFAAPFRGRYKTAVGSNRALRLADAPDDGAGRLIGYVDTVLPRHPSIACARRCDVVSFQFDGAGRDDGWTLGVVLPDARDALVLTPGDPGSASGTGGGQRAAVSAARIAWRVG
jgi:hypothetical protein